MDRERLVVTGLLVLQLLLWLGFVVHRSPRFPGSLSGSILGIAAAAFMVLPSLAYAVVKRIPAVKRRLVAALPLRQLLAWHVYAGILGSVLAILHTAHRFESTLGIVLTAVMLLTVFSGYVGRHFLGQVSLDLREKQALLGQLLTTYNENAADLAAQPEGGATGAASTSSRLSRGLSLVLRGDGNESRDLGRRAAELASSIAELEHAVQMHEFFNRRFAVWLTVHIVASTLFYGLLGLHIWAGVYFGLRWLA